MLLSELPFGALLTYSPHGTDEGAVQSLDYRDALKRDLRRGDPPELFSVLIARFVARTLRDLPFAEFLGSGVTLVPVPKSTLLQPGQLWVPERLARALADAGLAREVAPVLRRAKALPRASASPAARRPLPKEHFDSLAVEETLFIPERILLVDDVVTRGATLLGAASRLAATFPRAEIRAFAAMRTMSRPADFRALRDPCVGVIQFRSEHGDTLRRP